MTQLRGRLEGFVDQATTAGLSAATVAKLEMRSALQTATAEARVRLLLLPSRLAGLDSFDPVASWESAGAGGLEEQRSIILRETVDVWVLPAGRANRTFDPDLVKITPIW